MFGYVMANRDALSPEQLERFTACYCGLCRALKEDYGLTGRMTLTYDMAFLTMLLSSLYEPEQICGEARCLVHPCKKRPYAVSSITHYAAAMNFALAYHKFIDNWNDDKNILALSGAKLMERRYAKIEKLYPRQCAAIRSCLEQLAQLEKESCAVIDRPANAFGALLGEIFVMKEDIWADTLRPMGAALGRFIYVMDAWDDLPGDLKRKNYNPLADMADRDDLDDSCREILTMLIAGCTEEFEKLPLVDDIEILRNILYSGVWTRWEAIRRRKEGKESGGKGAKE